MSIESKIPNTDDGPIVAPCRRCGVVTPTRYAMKRYDSEGNYVGVSIAGDLCSDCKADLERRVAARNVDAARRKAINEQKLAKLLSHVPKQLDLNLGLD